MPKIHSMPFIYQTSGIAYNQARFDTASNLPSVRIRFGVNSDSAHERLFINMEHYKRDNTWAKKLFDEKHTLTQAVGRTSTIYTLLNHYIVPVYVPARKTVDRNDEGLFGKERIDKSTTPMFNSLYEAYNKRAERLIQAKGNTAVHQELGQYPNDEFTLKDKKGIIQRVSLDNGKTYIVLTGLVYSDFRGEFVNIVHPSPAKIKKAIFQRTDELLKTIKSLKLQPKNEVTLSTAINCVAEIHYLLANLMLYKRGSAGITDVLTKSLFDYLEISTPPWRGKNTISPSYPENFLKITDDAESFIRANGVSPDLEAFLTDLETFKQNYPYFFQQPLTFL